MDIYTAIRDGRIDDICKLLPNYRRAHDDDGIMAYAYLKNPHMLSVVYECGVPLDERDTSGSTVLMSAAAHGDLHTINWLIDSGADVNAVNQSGETAFSYACAWDQLEAAEILASRGADPNPLVGGDTTPLDDTELSDRIRSFLISIAAKRRIEL